MASYWSNALGFANLLVKGSPTIADTVLIADAATSPAGQTKQTTVGDLPFLQLAGGTMTGYLILNADPVNPLGAVTKQYADAISAGIAIQPAVYAATTADLGTITYSNGTAGVGATITNGGAQAAFMVDGTSPPINSRILVKNQTTTYENGCYALTTVGTGATNWVLTRTTDYDTTAQIKPGTLFVVNNGTVNASSSWIETATVTTIGTDPILFSEFSLNPAQFLQVMNNLSDVQSASTSRTNLGLGTMAVQNASNVAVTGGTISGVTLSATSVTTANADITGGTISGVTFSSAAATITGGAISGISPPIPVPSGGTGAATFTAYGPIIGGTTSTGALQSVSPGLQNQLLTSQGSGAPPTFSSYGLVNMQNYVGGGSYNAAGYYHTVIGESTMSITASTIYMIPFIPWQQYAFSAYYMYIVTGVAASNVGFCIYNASNIGAPGSILANTQSGLISSATNLSTASYAFGSPVTLQGGTLYYLGFWASSSSLKIAGNPVGFVNYWNGGSAGNSGQNIGIYNTGHSFGATMPASPSVTGPLQNYNITPVLALSG